MRVPKRTGAQGSDALPRLYALLYPNGAFAISIDAAYRAERFRGVEACQVWLHRGACPHAMESTMALIEAQQLDEVLNEKWSVRMTYAMALTRFVNSIADERQRGLYAQSIFRLAEQVGLPLWFVELRHASTHEDVPSLDVLRRASVEALGWLKAHFWLPTVEQQQQQQQQQQNVVESTAGGGGGEGHLIIKEAVEPLRAQLSAYRKMAKQVTRDASLRGPLRSAITASLGGIVGWIRRTNAAALVRRHDLDASHILAAVLMEPGHLIPLGKQKRVQRSSSKRLDEDGSAAALLSMTPLSAELVDVWMPLLTHVMASHDTFAAALMDDLVDCVTGVGDDSDSDDDGGGGGGDGGGDRSTHQQDFVDTAASWLLHLVLHSPISRQQQQQQQQAIVRRLLAHPTAQSIIVAQTLCEQSEQMMERFGHLLDLAQSSLQTRKEERPDEKAITDFDDDNDAIAEMERSIKAMEQRLDTLPPQQATAFDEANDSVHRVQRTEAGREERQRRLCQLLDGWSCLKDDEEEASSWKPTPLGCLRGQVPILEQLYHG